MEPEIQMSHTYPSANAATLRAALMPRVTPVSKLGMIFGGTIFIALMAQIAIAVPGSPVPVTGQTLAALLIGTSFGATMGIATFGFYLVVGALGAPVFASHTHGFTHITGATGGYLVGMLLTTAITGELAGRKWDQKISTAIPTMLLGSIATFSLGLIWLHHAAAQSWAWTIHNGLTPFLFGEFLKIAIASTSLPTVWRFIHRAAK